MQRLIDWYQHELKKLQVPVHLNTEAGPDAIKKMNPDVVFLAVGSTPVMLGFKGNDDPRVISCIDALLGKKKVGHAVVIVGGVRWVAKWHTIREGGQGGHAGRGASTPSFQPAPPCQS
jgi:2-enoate reductase